MNGGRPWSAVGHEKKKVARASGDSRVGAGPWPKEDSDRVPQP